MHLRLILTLFILSTPFLTCSSYCHSTDFAFSTLDSCITVITSTKDTLCEGESVQLSVQEGAYLCIWSPAVNISSPYDKSPLVNPLSDINYQVQAYTIQTETVFNGSFEGGVNNFSSDYAIGVEGPQGPLSEPGTFLITTDPSLANMNYPFCTDHTAQDTGRMMVIHGNDVLDAKIWCQTLSVEMNTSYLLSTWTTSLSAANPGTLQFSVNGTLLGSSFALDTANCEWIPYLEIWDSNTSSEVEFCITNQSATPGGSDFALDDISFAPYCLDSAEITLTVSNLAAELTEINNIDCNGSAGSAALSLLAEGILPYSYNWSTGDTDLSATNLLAGPFSITVADQASCEIVLEGIIEEEIPLDFDTILINQPNCGLSNGVINFNNGSLSGPYNYTLNNQVAVEVAATFSINDLGPGFYEIIITDENGCEKQDSFVLNISEGAVPEIIADNDGIICENPVMLTVGNFESYSWSDGTASENLLVEEPGLYILEVMNEAGCIGIDSIEVTSCSGWSIPDMFTPDNDGVNDTFGPAFIGPLDILDFKIYNRWGDLVHDRPRNWDGTFNGSPHPADVLIYRIVFQTPIDGILTQEGEVTLLR